MQYKTNVLCDVSDCKLALLLMAEARNRCMRQRSDLIGDLGEQGQMQRQTTKVKDASSYSSRGWLYSSSNVIDGG